MTARPKAILIVSVVTAAAAASFGALRPGGWWSQWRTPTFTRDIAPIVDAQCVTCHHEGGAGPFSLVTFPEVQRRARQIAEVTASRYMPPWLPAPQERGSEFRNARRLSDWQIRTFQRWLAAGTPEGDADTPRTAPDIDHDWRLGTPDLIIEMPASYELPAEGRDVYRNFVAPIPLTAPRYVRAVEMQPGDPRLVHHAFLQLDRSGEGRVADARDAEVGFPGMNSVTGAATPAGHFLSWQPGKVPSPGIPGIQWQLAPGADAIFQLHLRTTGKPERVQARAGLYFTDEPPSKLPFPILLRSMAIDIPAGEKNYVIESSYRLPVPVSVLAVLPHAHYLGRDLQGWAELPNGARKTIIHIPRWDFNWQGDYQFERPLGLPAGTLLRMRFTYDNSAENPANAQPPRRVEFGEQTSDEMGELWLQVVSRTAQEGRLLEQDYIKNYSIPDALALGERTLLRNPKDVPARTNYAGVLYQMGRIDDAERELHRALALDPEFPLAHSHLAHVYQRKNDLGRASAEYRKAIALNPNDYKAENNLGLILLRQGAAADAIAHFQRALALNPGDALATDNLKKATDSLREHPAGR